MSNRIQWKKRVGLNAGLRPVMVTLVAVGALSFFSTRLQADEPTAVGEEVAGEKSDQVKAVPIRPMLLVKPNGAGEASDQAGESETADEKADDRMVVPDGTAEQIFMFIDGIKARPMRSLNDMIESNRLLIEAATKIRAMEGLTVEQDTNAIQVLLASHEMLTRFSPPDREAFSKLVEELANDPRPEIQEIASKQKLKLDILGLRDATPEEAAAIVPRLFAMIDKQGIDREGYGLASTLARGLEYSNNVDLAVSVYEQLGERLRASDDEQLQKMAARIDGSIRRARLPGNPMEVFGTTGDGEPIDWASYRGKVVLVDYWASWCGPCRGEVPNMKKNLELYGDQGFAIVGINMDKTQEAYDKYVAEEEIPWVNIVAGEEEGNGWEHPMALHYGISGIPTAILVDKEGNVVSLSARGNKLDELLAELLGEPKAKEDLEAAATE